MATITSAQSGLASATTSWVGGVVPVENDKVIIALGHIITVDGTYEWGDDSNVITAIGTAAVNVSGTLKASRSVTSKLTVKGAVLLNHSTWSLDYGTDADPIPDGVVAELVLNRATTPAIRNGIAQLSATTAAAFQKVTFVGTNIRKRGLKLLANINAGSTVINVSDALHGWKVGDEILLFTTTNNTATNECEFRTIASINGGDARLITLNAAVTYTHLAGSPACNTTCNVILRPHNQVNTCSVNFASPNAATATLGFTIHMKNVIFRDFGTTSANTGAVFLGGSGPAGGGGFDHQFKSLVVVNTANAGGSCLRDIPRRYPKFEDCVFYARGPVFYQGSAFSCVKSWAACGSITSTGGTGSLIEDCWVTGIRDGVTLSMTSGSTARNCTVSGTGTNMLETGAAKITVENCDLGLTYGYRKFFGGIPHLVNATADAYFHTEYDVKDCLLNPILLSLSTDDYIVSTIGSFSKLNYINTNRDSTLQLIQTYAGHASRENGLVKRSTSSVKLTPIRRGRELVKSFKKAVGANGTVRVIGYVRMDATFFNSGTFIAPTVTISGLGVTPVVFTCPSSANEWHKYDISATSLVGYDAEFDISISATSQVALLGSVYFDGVPDTPFITKCRHYGFTFDEGNAHRTVNPIIQATESVAAAYTGVTINTAIPKLTFTTGTADTWRKVYDHYQAWACLNLTSPSLLTSADGNNFTVPANMEVDFQVVPADGTLLGGLIKLSIPAAYSYDIAGTTLEFTTAGTYDFANTKFGGTTTLVNTSGGAVIVKASAGIAFTNTGPNITIQLPTTDVAIVAPALIAGSRVQIYNITDGVEMYNTEIPSVGFSATLPFAGTKVLRLRADHATKLPLETAGVLSASGLTFLDVQDEDTVYIANAIDGSTITEFIPDGGNIQVDINDLDGVTDIQRVYAWLQWFMTTAEGIRSPFFGAISAVDKFNYVIDQTKANIRLDNVSAIPLRLIGGYLYRKDGGTVIAANSNSIHIDPGKAYIAESGVSGLTAGETAKLDMISTTAQQVTLLATQTSVVATKSVVDQTSIDVAAVKADTVLLNTNSASIKSDTTAILAKPDIVVPTVAQITTGVWSDTAATQLATKTTADITLSKVERNLKLDQNKAVISADGLVVTIYDDNGTTPLQVFNISSDKLTRTPV